MRQHQRPALSQNLLNTLGVSLPPPKRRNSTFASRKVARQTANQSSDKKTNPSTSHPKPRESQSCSSSEDNDDDEPDSNQTTLPFDQPLKSPKLSHERESMRQRSLALQQDDAEIARLEKRLGIKGRASKSLHESGMSDLLSDNTSIDEDHDTDDPAIQADKSWLQRKRRLLKVECNDNSNGKIGETEESGFSSDEEEQQEPVAKKVKENPYRPPTEVNQKYVPPSKRLLLSGNDQELLSRLRRQLQGSLNRLTELNIMSTVKEIDQILATNPRQHGISTLIGLLMGLLCDKTVLLDSFLILHAALISAIYKILGAHFGGQFLEKFVSEFSRFYHQESVNPSGAKECSNLISLLANLHSFQLVNSSIVFDYIKMFCSSLTELNAELLLRIIKSCGPQLRADDPTALKDVIVLVHRAVAEKGESNLSVRTKFMIEAITDLKNNKVKDITSNLSGDSFTRMKKALGTLSFQNLKGSEPLGVGLKDIEAKHSKWWLIGASWKHVQQTEAASQDNVIENGKQHQNQNQNQNQNTDKVILDESIISGLTSNQLLQLSKAHRMNTDIRRSVFMTILSAADFKDCHLKLRRIGLNKKQQVEIPRVLVYCAGMENQYNPYYKLVANQMCSDHRFRKAFEFCFWNLLRRLDEGVVENEVDVGLNEVVNVAKMYGEMIASHSLSISILKVIDFMHLRPKTKTLIEMLFVSMFQTLDKCHDEKQLFQIFSRIKDAPKLVTGLRYFIPAVIVSTVLVPPKQQKYLKKSCHLAMDILTVIHSATAT